MKRRNDHAIPELFAECLEGNARLEEHDFKKCGELICDRCGFQVPVAAFNYYGFPSEPMMETIGECCFEECDDASNIIITWKAGPKEANYNKCCEDPRAFKRKSSSSAKGMTSYEL